MLIIIWTQLHKPANQQVGKPNARSVDVSHACIVTCPQGAEDGGATTPRVTAAGSTAEAGQPGAVCSKWDKCRKHMESAAPPGSASPVLLQLHLTDMTLSSMERRLCYSWFYTKYYMCPIWERPIEYFFYIPTHFFFSWQKIEICNETIVSPSFFFFFLITGLWQF